MSSRLARWLLGVCVALAAALTLGPLPVDALTTVSDAAAHALGGTARSRRTAVEQVGNVLMFAVPAYLACRALPTTPPRLVLATGVACSVVVEVLQAVALNGRHTDVRDLVLNIVGTIVGVTCARVTGRDRARPPDARQTPRG